MNWIITIWIIIIGIEIFRNWCIIEVTGKRPTYWWSNCIRVFVGFLFWVVSKMFSDITSMQWWGMIPMMLLTFWWIFDYGLTVLRNFMHRFKDFKKPPIIFHYLNPKGSWLDQMQCNYPNTLVWFWFKLMLMIGGIAISYYGIDAIWIPKW